MVKKESPLDKFIQIQDMQFKLDELKINRGKLNTEIRSIGQKLPQLIREAPLK